MTVRGASARGCELKGYAAPDVMRADQVRAYREDGTELRIMAVTDSVASGGKQVPVPRYRIEGPVPATFKVSYRVSPGRREGNEHLGYSGRAFGHLGRDFGLITGRTLFLLPEPAASYGLIRVGFDLPKTWTAATPWRQVHDGFLVEAPHAKPFDLLATAAIGLGPFREETFTVGNTSVRLTFSSAIPESEARRSAQALESVVRYVRHAFGRDLGEQYAVVAVPETPAKDEIIGEGWAYGQGGTLSPLTPGRARTFAQRLIEAYTVHAPFRTEIRRLEEFWVVDGITNWYSWRAAASAGLADEDQVGHSMASEYLTAMTTPGVQRDLESLYAGGKPDRIAREVLAPFALLYLDHELRTHRGASSGFDAILPKLYATGSAPSLWSIVGHESPGDWDRFRARFVRGTDLAPIPNLFPIAPTRATPSPVHDAPIRYLTIAYSGNTYGYLENCGCKVNQSGGVARRATALARIRSRDPQTVVLDAGNTFARPERSNTPSFLEDGEQRLYLETVDLMKYNAAAVGLTELAWSPEYFQEHVKPLRTPYLAANVLWGGRPIGRKEITLKSGGMTVLVVGVLDPPRGGGTTVRRFSESAARLQFLDPVEEVRKIAAGKSSADLLVVMGTLSPWTIRRIAAACPDVDVVLSTAYDGPHWLPSSGGSRPVMTTDDSTGFLGQTLVLYTYRGQYGISSARLGVDRSGRIVSADRTEYWLDESVPDYPLIRDRLNRFYDEVGKTQMAQASVRPPLGDDPYWQNKHYAGAARCASCHSSEYDQWKNTPHATAFKTLLDRHRHYQPTCVSCHVVGFGSRWGYRVGDAEVPLGNVQCEVCHGPGQEHAMNPLPSNIRRAVPERVCLECHNPDHSDHFVYAERLPLVLHERLISLKSP
jgi:predicted metalloprotease with PDZ domain